MLSFSSHKHTSMSVGGDVFRQRFFREEAGKEYLGREVCTAPSVVR